MDVFLTGAPDDNTVRNLLTSGRHLHTLGNEMLRGESSEMEMEDTLVRLDDWLQQIENAIGHFSEDDLQQERLVGLNRDMRTIARNTGRMRQNLRDRLSRRQQRYQAPVIRNGTMGRPRYNVTPEQLTLFHQLGFTWAAVARMIGRHLLFL